MNAHQPDDRDLPAECREAEAFGVDLDLLRANLDLVPAERLLQFQRMITLHEQIQQRTLTQAVLERRDQLELAEKLRFWARLESRE